MRRSSAVAPLIVALFVSALVPLDAAASAPPDAPAPDDSAADDSTVDGTVGDPPIGPDSPDFERQLAELAFRKLMADSDAAATGTVACSEPDNTVDGAITCFHVLDGVVTVATTTASDGTGSFFFTIVSTGGEPVVDPEARQQADLLIAAQAEQINLDSQRFISDYEADERIESVERYEFDSEASVLAIEFTLAADADFDLAVVAWANTREFARFYWAEGGSFRSSDATKPPGLIVTVDGEAFESDHALMVDVADEAISEADWREAVTGEVSSGSTP